LELYKNKATNYNSLLHDSRKDNNNKKNEIKSLENEIIKKETREISDIKQMNEVIKQQDKKIGELESEIKRLHFELEDGKYLKDKMKALDDLNLK